MATTTSNRLLASVLSASIALAPVAVRRAWAEPTAADMETARDLYKQAKLLRASGDLKGALEKLKAAHALAGTPITGVELGKTYMELGMLVEARESFLEVGRMPVGAKESANAKAARAEAAKLESEVAPRIPTIVVKLAGVPEGATPTVTIDGAVVPEAAISEPRKVDPGKHVVAARIGDGEETSMEIDVKESEQQPVELTVKAPKTTPTATTVKPTSAATTTAIVPETKAESAGTSPWVWIGFGAAGLGLLAGSITGGIALSRAGTVKNDCKAGFDCPPTAQGDIDTSKTMGTISTIAFVVGGVGAAVGIIALVGGSKSSSTSSASTSPTLQAWVGPASIGLGGSF